MEGFFKFKLKIFLLRACMLLMLIVVVTANMNAEEYHIKTIVIDAGHGGKDPGASGKISKEKDINLNVALLTGKYIEQYLPDVKVIYTRKTDEFIDLKRRPQIANENNADLFISIHVNALDNHKMNGASTWTIGRHKTEASLAVARLENKVLELEEDYEENYQGFDPKSPDSYIIFSMMQNAFSKQSVSLAEDIQEQFSKRVGRRNYGVHQAGFWVLFNTSMPSVLVELGFITNEKEERFLASAEGQDYMASAIFRAVRGYKQKIEAKSKVVVLQEKIVPTDNATNDVERPDAPVFKLQFLTSSKKMEDLPSGIRNLEGLSFYKEGNFYKYTLGASTNLETIRELRREYEDQFSDAFIVAFKNGIRIPTSDALKEITQ